MAQTDWMNQRTSETGTSLRVEERIRVPASAERVYDVWHNFTRFPEFMSNVEEVRPVGDNRYHWVARIFGMKQEWDAEVIEAKPNERIAWRSVSGAPNAGSVTLRGREPGVTEIELVVEYTPPAGKAGKALDKLTKTTQREIREDLVNFNHLVSGTPSGGLLTREPGPTEFGGVLASLTGPVIGATAGGLLAYSMRREVLDRIAWNRPASWINAPLAQMASGRAAPSLSPTAGPSPVGSTATAVSWTMSAAAIGSIAISAGLRMANRRQDALFVGQWAPTLLGWGLLTRIQGHRGVRHDRGASVSSWAMLGASLGSVVASALQHLRGKRHDGLFVGQWAPTFMVGASLMRLLNR